MIDRVRSARWWILAGIALATAALGLWGFADYNEATGQAASVWDQIYLVIQLFTINIGVPEVPISWPLIVARFGGVVVTVWLGLLAFTAIFREEWSKLRLKARKPDVVVLGLGACGSILARSFADAGHRVAAVERAEGPSIDECRHAGIVVLTGDATDRTVLDAVRVRDAGLALVMCGRDSLNAEVVLRIDQALDGRASAAPLECHVHIEDSDLSSMLAASVRADAGGDRMRVEFFNPSARAAPAMLEMRPIDAVAAVDPNVLVVGLGQMGRQLVVHAARWRALVDQAKLALTVVDREVEERWQRLVAQEPEIEAHCDVRRERLDVSSGDFVKGRFLVEMSERGPITHVFICLDDDVRAATAALAVQQALRRERVDVPVVVRMFRSSGLAGVLRNDPAEASPTVPFALADWSCQREILLDERTELVARALHQIYLRQCEVGGKSPDQKPAMRPWRELAPEYVAGNREQAADVDRKLELIDWVAWPADRWDGPLPEIDEADVETLSRLEHDRWWDFKRRSGWRFDERDDDVARTSHLMVPWEDLDPGDADYDRAFIRDLPRTMLRAGFLSGPRREVMARLIHERYVESQRRAGVSPEENPSMTTWSALPEDLREANRAQVDAIDERLARAGLVRRPAPEVPRVDRVRSFDPATRERYAREEHDRWWQQKREAGWKLDARKDAYAKTSPDMVPWEELSPATRDKDYQAVDGVFEVLESVGLAVTRSSTPAAPAPL